MVSGTGCYRHFRAPSRFGEEASGLGEEALVDEALEEGGEGPRRGRGEGERGVEDGVGGYWREVGIEAARREVGGGGGGRTPAEEGPEHGGAGGGAEEGGADVVVVAAGEEGVLPAAYGPGDGELPPHRRRRGVCVLFYPISLVRLVLFAGQIAFESPL
jgi:hypothetical protein